MLHTLAKSAYNLNDTDVDNLLEKIDITDTNNISAARAIESILLFLQTKGYDKQIADFIDKLKLANTAYSEYLQKALIYWILQSKKQCWLFVDNLIYKSTNHKKNKT